MTLFSIILIASAFASGLDTRIEKDASLFATTCRQEPVECPQLIMDLQVTVDLNDTVAACRQSEQVCTQLFEGMLRQKAMEHMRQPGGATVRQSTPEPTAVTPTEEPAPEESKGSVWDSPDTTSGTAVVSSPPPHTPPPASEPEPETMSLADIAKQAPAPIQPAESEQQAEQPLQAAATAPAQQPLQAAAQVPPPAPPVYYWPNGCADFAWPNAVIGRSQVPGCKWDKRDPLGVKVENETRFAYAVIIEGSAASVNLLTGTRVADTPVGPVQVGLYSQAVIPVAIGGKPTELPRSVVSSCDGHYSDCRPHYHVSVVPPNSQVYTIFPNGGDVDTIWFEFTRGASGEWIYTGRTIHRTYHRVGQKSYALVEEIRPGQVL